VNIWIALLLSYAGMTGLSLAMKRHHDQVWRRKRAVWETPALRLIGTSLLVLALALSVREWGGSVGVVVWLGLVSAGALLVAWLLAFRPRQGALLAVALALAGTPAGLALALG